MAKIFISYRRSDSQHAVDRLQQEMRPYVKDAKRDIFVDVDNIPIGRDFEEHLQGKVSECDALLAVIGPDWLTSKKEDGSRRLDDPEDFVRTEIAAALSRNIPVVPVLLDGAQVPHASQLPENLKALAKRNGAQLDRKSFAADVDHIMTGLGLSKSGGGGAGKWVAGLVAVAALAVGGWFGANEFGVFDPAPPEGELAEITEGLRGIGEPDFVEIVDADQDTFDEPAADAEYRAELIARYQAALGALEYYDGIVDGIPGDAIHDASKAFTAEHGRTNLGLDFANLDALERLVIYAEDTLETKELNEARLEDAGRDRAHADAMDAIREMAPVEDTKPDWARDLSERANTLADNCLGGSSDSCFSLANKYVNGEDGLRVHYDHARTLYIRACDGGNFRSCNELGVLYLVGIGVTPDRVEAKTYYRKACDGGISSACDSLRRFD